MLKIYWSNFLYIAQFMRLVKLMVDIEDYKSWLWVPLTLKQKFKLYLKSSRQRERELISLLFMLDFKQASENKI